MQTKSVVHTSTSNMSTSAVKTERSISQNLSQPPPNILASGSSNPHALLSPPPGIPIEPGRRDVILTSGENLTESSNAAPHPFMTSNNGNVHNSTSFLFERNPAASSAINGAPPVLISAGGPPNHHHHAAAAAFAMLNGTLSGSVVNGGGPSAATLMDGGGSNDLSQQFNMLQLTRTANHFDLSGGRPETEMLFPNTDIHHTTNPSNNGGASNTFFHHHSSSSDKHHPNFSQGVAGLESTDSIITNGGVTGNSANWNGGIQDHQSSHVIGQQSKWPIRQQHQSSGSVGYPAVPESSLLLSSSPIVAKGGGLDIGVSDFQSDGRIVNNKGLMMGSAGGMGGPSVNSSSSSMVNSLQDQLHTAFTLVKDVKRMEVYHKNYLIKVRDSIRHIDMFLTRAIDECGTGSSDYVENGLMDAASRIVMFNNNNQQQHQSDGDLDQVRRDQYTMDQISMYLHRLIQSSLHGKMTKMNAMNAISQLVTSHSKLHSQVDVGAICRVVQQAAIHPELISGAGSVDSTPHEKAALYDSMCFMANFCISQMVCSSSSAILKSDLSHNHHHHQTAQLGSGGGGVVGSSMLDGMTSGGGGGGPSSMVHSSSAAQMTGGGCLMEGNVGGAGGIILTSSSSESGGAHGRNKGDTPRNASGVSSSGFGSDYSGGGIVSTVGMTGLGSADMGAGCAGVSSDESGMSVAIHNSNNSSSSSHCLLLNESTNSGLALSSGASIVANVSSSSNSSSASSNKNKDHDFNPLINSTQHNHDSFMDHGTPSSKTDKRNSLGGDELVGSRRRQSFLLNNNNNTDEPTRHSPQQLNINQHHLIHSSGGVGSKNTLQQQQQQHCNDNSSSVGSTPGRGGGSCMMSVGGGDNVSLDSSRHHVAARHAAVAALNFDAVMSSMSNSPTSAIVTEKCGSGGGGSRHDESSSCSSTSELVSAISQITQQRTNHPSGGRDNSGPSPPTVGTSICSTITTPPSSASTISTTSHHQRNTGASLFGGVVTTSTSSPPHGPNSGPTCSTPPSSITQPLSFAQIAGAQSSGSNRGSSLSGGHMEAKDDYFRLQMATANRHSHAEPSINARNMNCENAFQRRTSGDSSSSSLFNSSGAQQSGSLLEWSPTGQSNIHNSPQPLSSTTSASLSSLPSPSNVNSIRYFMDIALISDTPGVSGGRFLGRVIVETHPHVAPKMCKNFAMLMTNERGFSYKGCQFFQAWKNESVICGDWEYNSGRGGRSALEGEPLFTPDDTKLLCVRGALGMRRMSKKHSTLNQVASQFRVILSHMNTQFTGIFGHVVSGIEALDEVADLGGEGGRPQKLAAVVNCGVYKN